MYFLYYTEIYWRPVFCFCLFRILKFWCAQWLIQYLLRYSHPVKESPIQVKIQRLKVFWFLNHPGILENVENIWKKRRISFFSFFLLFCLPFLFFTSFLPPYPSSLFSLSLWFSIQHYNLSECYRSLSLQSSYKSCVSLRLFYKSTISHVFGSEQSSNWNTVSHGM
jgi:hypothetical protein